MSLQINPHVLTRTKAILKLEGFWGTILTAFCVAALFLSAAWFNLFDRASLPLHFAMLALFAGLFLFLVYRAFNIKRTSHHDVLSRLDDASGLPHAPFSSLQDVNVTESELSQRLWAHHIEKLNKLVAGVAKPKLQLLSENIDRYALRSIAGLLAVVAFFVAGDERMSRLSSIVDFNKGNAPNWRVSVWMTPPEYTGMPSTVLLNEAAGVQSTAAITDIKVADIKVPEGSKIFIKPDGLKNFKAIASHTMIKDKDFYTITQNATLSISGLPKKSDTVFQFNFVKDQAPTIAFSETPVADDKNQLKLATLITDDYGVVEALAHITLPQALKERLSLQPRALFELTPLPLGVPPRGSKEVITSLLDLSSHPLAGELVMLKLTTKDDLGQIGQSEPLLVRLPIKNYKKPLARALIEQRMLISLDVNLRYKVLRSLESMMIAPQNYLTTHEYLGLRTAFARLNRSRSNEQFQSFADYLLEIANFIEDGTLSDNQKQVKQAQDALKQAIERNAPQDEIAKLMQALREAMNKMMAEMTKQLREQQKGQKPQATPPQNRMNAQTMNDILKQIEELMRKGEHEQARKLLEELQAQMQALQEAMEDGRLSLEEGSPNDKLSELSDMIRREQDLRDETFQKEQRGEKDQQGLSEQQEALRKKLEDMNKDGEPNDGLSQAEKDMKAARDALKEGKGREAMEAQRRALENLQKGAQAENEKQRGQAGDNNGQPNPNQPPQSGNLDPLGRPRKEGKGGENATGENGGASAYSGNSAGERAGKILDELRRRAGENARPKAELDYIERLLKGLK